MVVSYAQKRIKVYIGELAHPFWGMGDFFTIGSPLIPEKVKPILIGRSFK